MGDLNEDLYNFGGSSNHDTFKKTQQRDGRAKWEQSLEESYTLS